VVVLALFRRRGGERHVLRAAIAGHERRVGYSHAARLSVQRQGIRLAHRARRRPAAPADELKRMLATTVRKRDTGCVRNREFGAEARAWALSELKKALRPLRDAEKLGYVLFQLAPWVKRSDEALADLTTIRRGLPDMIVAVEFRNRSWFGEHTDETLRFLHDRDLTYVSIDGPRSRLTVPLLPALTTETAVFRLHGRNFHGFLKQVQGKAPSAPRSTTTSTRTGI
jgi:uncharacterized protein YecE (DUF72 family)